MGTMNLSWRLVSRQRSSSFNVSFLSQYRCGETTRWAAYLSGPCKQRISDRFKCRLALFVNAEFIFKVREIYNSKKVRDYWENMYVYNSEKVWEYWEKYRNVLVWNVKYFLVKLWIYNGFSFSLKWGILHSSESLLHKLVWIPAFLCNQ